jgi:hypothetical protein
MRSFKSLLATAAILLTASLASAQTHAVKGSLKIDYQTRTQTDAAGAPLPGVKDTYTLSLDVTDSMMFGGTIQHTPRLAGGLLGRETQSATLAYDIMLSVRNPANPAQTKAIGKFIGGVPIDGQGVYRYGNGTLRIAVDASGRAAEFQSRFSGLAAGKPPKVASASITDSLKQQAVSIFRQVKGQTQKVVVTDYDKMRFDGLILAAGPVKTYGEAKVNGEMLYDYERDLWFFQGVTVSYEADGMALSDKLSGNIKWIEDPQRATNGKGEYQFDVRVNEPEAQKGTTEASVFATDDEAAFFAVDSTIPALTGSARYVDTMSGDTVTSSAVTIDTAGNLTKQQMVYLTKLIWLVSVVPFNAE